MGVSVNRINEKRQRNSRKYSAVVFIQILVLFTAVLPESGVAYEKKKTWDKTLNANPVEGERVLDGWYVFGPLHTRTLLWKNPYPPETNVDPGLEVDYHGKKVKWERQSMRKGNLKISSNQWREHFVFADFAWSQPERVIFQVHARDVRYMKINGKKVWEWDYISGQEYFSITADLKQKNRIFLQMSSHWHALLRITYCSERVARERVKLLLYLSEQFSGDHQRIFSAAKEIRHYLHAYGGNLSPEFRNRSYQRIKAVLEQSLTGDISVERFVSYLEFCHSIGLQPQSLNSLREMISRCPEKDRPGLLFKLAGMYITSFGSPARGWDLFRNIMNQPEIAKSRVSDLTKFCSDHGFYLEGAELLSVLAGKIPPKKQLDIQSRISALYRQAGETEKALVTCEKIKDAGAEMNKNDNETSEKVKRAGNYISSLFRMINKENVCILPQAIGFGNELDYIGKLAANGQIKKAYTELNRLIKTFGSNIVDAGNESWVGTMVRIEETMQSWPEEFKQAVFKNIKEVAANAIQEINISDRKAHRKLWNACRMSASAAELFVSHAEYLLMTGDVKEAASWYESIIKRNPAPSLYLSYAYALYLSGQDQRAQDIKNHLDKKKRTARVRFRGKSTDLISGLDALSNEFTHDPQPVPIRIPSVKAWSDRVSPEDRIRCKADNAYSGIVQPPCVPVRKDNILYVYTGAVLRAVDIRTGKHCWSVRVRDGARILDETPVPVFRMLVCEDRIYVRVPGREYALKAYSRTSGKEVWSSRREPGLGGLHIASEPARVNGLIVFTAALDHRWGRTIFSTELFAAAVCPDTGQLIWKQLLVAGDSTYGNEHLSRHLPRALEINYGIFIQTNRKVFQLLDPITGSVEWALRYRRSAEQKNRYTLHENIAAAYRDSVVVAPRDSSYIYCLDIQKGRIRWIVSKGLSPVLCGIYKGSAVLLGRNLCLKHMVSGKELKSTRVFRQNYFPLPFLSGKRLWISYPSSAAVYDLETLKEVQGPSFMEQTRLYPAYGCAVAEHADHITVYRNSSDEVSPAGDTSAQTKRFVPAAKNCMVHHRVLKGKQKLLSGGDKPNSPTGAVRPLLWWMKPMDMSGCVGIRSGTELLVWSHDCMRLIETERFGEILWEHSYDPSGFRVNHAQNIGNRVLVRGSRDISCLDIASGREHWRVRMPMYISSLHYNDGKAYLYSHKSWSRSYRWRTDLLNVENGEITRFSAGNKYAVPVLWDNKNLMLFRKQKGFYAVDVNSRKRLWEKEMENRWFKRASIIKPAAGEPILYMQRGEDLLLMKAYTGTLHYSAKEWKLLSGIWQAYGEPYAYYKNRVKRLNWNRSKQTLEEKWNTAIKDLDHRRMIRYGIVGENLAVFSHAGDHYIEITQLDRETGTIKRRDKLVQVSGGYHTLHSPRWYGNRVYVMSDRMLYCFRFPVNKTLLAEQNAQRKKMLKESFNRADRARSIRMYEISSRELRPSLDLINKKLVLNTNDQWFPSDGTDASRWKGTQDASLTIGGITPVYTLRFQIDVTDDTWIPYTGDQFAGDRVVLTTGINTAYIGMNTNLKPVVRGLDSRYIGNYSCQVLNSGTIRYTFEFDLHPHYFKEYHHSRHSTNSSLSIGVMYVDDDGNGVKGTLAWPYPHEWGVLRLGRK